MEILTPWISANVNIFCLALFAQILLSDSSPLSKEARGSDGACAKGWIHYQRFCVTHAKGESDATIALYCDGFGGVGINGYCITKAHNTAVENFLDTSKDQSGNLGDSLWRDAEHKTEGTSNIGDLMDASVEGDGQSYEKDEDKNGVEEIACPKGWRHYGKICVYQPLSIKEQCHLLNAVSFSGLCLKHADLEAVERRGLKYNVSGKAKRVCCCAHVHAKSNGYGCI